MYWVLGDVPGQSRSTLASIYLAVLCKADDTKQFGFEKVLDPLLTELQSLERDGVCVPSFGNVIRGTMLCLVADNLGAHSVAGFVKNFTGSHVCHVCCFVLESGMIFKQIK